MLQAISQSYRSESENSNFRISVYKTSSRASDHTTALRLHAHISSTFGDSFGQIFATTWVTTSGFSRAEKSLTLTTFSCQRRVAQRLIHFNGAYRVTGTQIRRADFLMILDATVVAL